MTEGSELVVETFLPSGSNVSTGAANEVFPKVSELLFQPSHILVVQSGEVYISSQRHVILKVDLEGNTSVHAGQMNVKGHKDGPMKESLFCWPNGLQHENDQLFVVDGGTHHLRMVDQKLGVVTTLAGSGNMETVDGLAMKAGFSSPISLLRTYVESQPDGIITTMIPKITKIPVMYTADRHGHVIRSYQEEKVTTVAGNGRRGFQDGPALTLAKFDQPTDLCLSQTGLVYIADMYNHKIRVWSVEGQTVTTLCGTVKGFLDGGIQEAQLSHPFSVREAPSRDVIFSDPGNNLLRKFDIIKKCVVTLAGVPNKPGYQNGDPKTSRFNDPAGIDISSDGDLYITECLNGHIRKIRSVCGSSWDQYMDMKGLDTTDALFGFIEAHTINLGLFGEPLLFHKQLIQFLCPSLLKPRLLEAIVEEENRWTSEAFVLLRIYLYSSYLPISVYSLDILLELDRICILLELGALSDQIRLHLAHRVDIISEELTAEQEKKDSINKPKKTPPIASVKP